VKRPCNKKGMNTFSAESSLLLSEVKGLWKISRIRISESYKERENKDG